jgi:hypothetical protein
LPSLKQQAAGRLPTGPFVISRPRADLLKKLCAAILTAVPQHTLIINDFLSGESRSFEKAFLSLVKELKKREKMVVYLGKRKLDSAAPIEERIIKYNDYLLESCTVHNNMTTFIAAGLFLWREVMSMPVTFP